MTLSTREPNDDPESASLKMLSDAKDAREQGDLVSAEALLQKLLERSSSAATAADAHFELAEICWERDRNSDAIENLGEAQRLYTEAGDNESAARATELVGDVLFDEGDFADALERFESSGAQLKAARAMWFLGREADAVSAAEAAAAAISGTGNVLVAGSIYREFGELFLEAKRPREALVWLDRALSAYRSGGSEHWEHDVLDSIREAREAIGSA